jgi:hypothetical protein
MHGITATINPDQPRGSASTWRFQQLAWIGLMQGERWWRQQQGLSAPGVFTVKGGRLTSRLHPNAVQTFQKLELLPHSWWQHQQWAHKQDVHQTGPCSQSKCNKDQHDEQVACGSPQDNSTFSLQPRASRPRPATFSRPSAATSAPRQLHQFYGTNDAFHALPPNALHGAPIWTYSSSCCSACTILHMHLQRAR